MDEANPEAFMQTYFSIYTYIYMQAQAWIVNLNMNAWELLKLFHVTPLFGLIDRFLFTLLSHESRCWQE